MTTFLVQRVAFSTLALALAAHVAFVGSARAQAHLQPVIGVGYVANAPEELAGAMIWGLIPGLGGWGLYVDAKLDTSPESNRSNFLGVTPELVDSLFPEDGRLNARDSWRGFNVAVVRPLTPQFAVYVGAGYAEWTRYYEFFDPDGQRGLHGFYWGESPNESGSTTNFLAGAILSAGKWIRFHFGGETRPGGLTVGASLVWPPR